MPALPDWITLLRGAMRGEKTGLITVLATEGSVPRGAGTHMLVTVAGQRGTIGGGRLESQAIDQARAMLDLPAGAWRIQDYPLGPLLGQCCGGRVRLLVEHLDLDPDGAAWLDRASPGQILVGRLEEGRIDRAIIEGASPAKLAARGDRPAIGSLIAERIGEERRPLYLFGAGHVGQAIAAAVAPLPFDLAWFDTREDYAGLPGVMTIATADAGACMADVPADAAVLILTHDHGLDYTLVAAALCGRASFVGLIGSATKRARFLARLTQDGIDATRLTCPIGLEAIRGKEPEIIAVSAVAQLLALRPPRD